jgi:hypothetical protein
MSTRGSVLDAPSAQQHFTDSPDKGHGPAITDRPAPCADIKIDPVDRIHLRYNVIVQTKKTNAAIRPVRNDGALKISIIRVSVAVAYVKDRVSFIMIFVPRHSFLLPARGINKQGTEMVFLFRDSLRIIQSRSSL